MGIVARQSMITSIISYTGIVVGYLNLIYLYPKFLELEQVGLLRTIQDAAILMVPLASLGIPQIISRYYPRYAATAERYAGFLGLLLLTATAGYLVVSLVFSLGKDFLFSSFREKAPQVMDHTGLILLLLLLLCYFGIFEQIARSQIRSATPAFLREVVLRMLQAGILGLYAINWIDFNLFLLLSVLLYAGLLLFLLFYLDINKVGFKIPFRQFKSDEVRELFIFGLISFIGISATMIFSKIDSLMVSGMVGLEAAAIYTTTFYMATVIEVPKRAMTQSATAVLSIAFEKGNMHNCERVYRQTALNQMIIGGLLMIGLWANTANIFEIMPKGELYAAGANVILLIGLTRLIDMSFGPSSEVIGLSRYYWANLVVISFLATASVVMNLYFIPRYGINGAALGTLIAILSYNVIKFIFIIIKLGIHPFSKYTVRSLAVIGMTTGLNLILPDFENVFLDMVLRSAALSTFYASLILGLNCSPEVSEQFHLILKKIGLR